MPHCCVFSLGFTFHHYSLNFLGLRNVRVVLEHSKENIIQHHINRIKFKNSFEQTFNSYRNLRVGSLCSRELHYENFVAKIPIPLEFHFSNNVVFVKILAKQKFHHRKIVKHICVFRNISILLISTFFIIKKTSHRDVQKNNL